MKKMAEEVELQGFMKEKFEEYHKKITLSPTKGKPVFKEAKLKEIQEIRDNRLSEEIELKCEV